MRDLDEYISPPYLSDVEHGKRKIGYEKLYHLAVVLGKSMNWFSEGWIDK
jgi:transcriptional regulator with XRE-family HTH domain